MLRDRDFRFPMKGLLLLHADNDGGERALWRDRLDSPAREG
jgi:hypothetical protein